MIQELRDSKMEGQQHHTQDTASMIQSIEALFARLAIQVALVCTTVSLMPWRHTSSRP